MKITDAIAEDFRHHWCQHFAALAEAACGYVHCLPESRDWCRSLLLAQATGLILFEDDWSLFGVDFTNSVLPYLTLSHGQYALRRAAVVFTRAQLAGQDASGRLLDAASLYHREHVDEDRQSA